MVDKYISTRVHTKCRQGRFGILLGLLLISSGCSNSENQTPSCDAVVVGGVSCHGPAWLIGSIDPDKQRYYTHTFIIENKTEKRILIEQVKPDCACIFSENNPCEIPAHDSVGIKVGFNAPFVPGQFNHTVQVRFGGTRDANLLLKIHGTIVPTAALHASPSSLDFGRVSQNETRERTIRISRYDSSNVGITRITNNIEGCELETTNAYHSQTILLSVRLKGATLRPGMHSGVIIVETNHPTYRSLQIPIKGEVRGPTDGFVSALFFNSLAPGSRREFTPYRSSLLQAKWPQIARLDYDGDPGIEIRPLGSQKPGEDVHLWQLCVASNVKAGGVIKGVLRIRVSDRTSDNIEVPVIVLVR